jgi:AcrR family transcriptional regulator
MTVPEPTIASREPSARACAQRERILGAAKQCFVGEGFHAASMAEIAKAADMSPGLIYRYFDSKAAIVRAIIDRQIEDARCVLDQLGSAEDLVSAILDAFEGWTHSADERMNAALFFEMIALATRDPEIADATRAADQVIRGRLEQALARSGNGATADQVRCLATTLQCLIEGLLVRAIRQPDLDRDVLRACLEGALASVGSAAPGRA